MTERDDFSEALELARRDEVSPEEVRKLALALAPVYGAAIASSTASASSAVSASGAASTGAGSSLAAGATGAAGTGAVIMTKTIIATLTVAAIGAASYGALRAGTPPAEPAARATRLAAPVSAPARAAEPSAIEPGLEPPQQAPSAIAPEHPQPSKSRAIAPRKNTPVEAQLLTQARSALRDDPSRALRLADAHRARFPRGALAHERELLAIRALERLGRAEQAAARRARALRELPRSTALERSGPLEPETP